MFLAGMLIALRAANPSHRTQSIRRALSLSKSRNNKSNLHMVDAPTGELYISCLHRPLSLLRAKLFSKDAYFSLPASLGYQTDGEIDKQSTPSFLSNLPHTSSGR
jgi:hypothetical protein